MELYPSWLSTTLASDAAEGRGVFPPWIQALIPDRRVVGPAFVVLASQDDNQAVTEALASSPPAGCVLVVAGHSTGRAATIGGLLAFQIQNLGIAGLVTDGLVRDVQEIRQLGLPVWCRGTTPLAPKKGGPGVVGGIVVIGGMVVQDGDLVIADDDGVVVWPKNDIPALLARAQAKLEADNERLAHLRQVAGQKRSENEGQPK